MSTETDSRVQLALNVADLEASIAFYSKLFNTTPHKLRPGYANFEIANPPLKLVLMETTEAVRGTGPQGALNHLGVELMDLAAVSTHGERLRADGFELADEMNTTCCFALQDKFWAHDPSGTPWEFYSIKNDNPAGMQMMSLAETATGACCAPGEACN